MHSIYPTILITAVYLTLLYLRQIQIGVRAGVQCTKTETAIALFAHLLPPYIYVYGNYIRIHTSTIYIYIWWKCVFLYIYIYIYIYKSYIGIITYSHHIYIYSGSVYSYIITYIIILL